MNMALGVKRPGLKVLLLAGGSWANVPVFMSLVIKIIAMSPPRAFTRIH